MIDAHVHILPEDVRKPGFRLPRGEEAVKAAIFDQPNVDKVIKKTSCESLLRSMDSCGLQRTIVMGFPWNSADLCLSNNIYVKNCINKYPGKISGVAVIQPRDSKGVVDHITKYIEEDGFVGVKVIPSWQGYKLSDVILDKVMQKVIDLDTVLVTHVDHPYKGFDYDHPHYVVELADRYPEAKILCDHLGGLLCLYNIFPPMKKVMKNLYFLTTVAHTMKFVELAAQCLDEDRLLFGTDHPFIYPYNQQKTVNGFNKLNLPQDLKKKITCQNIVNFFNIA